MLMEWIKSSVYTVFILTMFVALSNDANAGSPTDYDCIVYRCYTSVYKPIPSDRYNDDEYICEHGGATCELFPVPGAPADCPPIKVCFFDSRGYTKMTYHCTTDQSGEYPKCPDGNSTHSFVAFLNIGEGTGFLTERIITITRPEYHVRRMIYCVQPNEDEDSVVVCPFPEWLHDLINEMREEWESDGETDTHTYIYECTSEGCMKYCVTY